MFIGCVSVTYREKDVLDDDVRSAPANSQSSAFDDTTAADADKTLVAGDLDWAAGCIVIGASACRVVASVHNPQLAIGLTSVGTTLCRRRSRVTGIVPGLGDHDDSCSRVGEPCLQSE